MNFDFNETQLMIRDTARKFAEDELARRLGPDVGLLVGLSPQHVGPEVLHAL